MSIISRTGDLFYAFRFLKLLTTPWEKTKAFEHGIVDKDGKSLMKSSEIKDPDAKASFTVFHRLVFNIKRLLGKLPFGKSKLASYAAALFLIKEHTNLTEKQIEKILDKAFDIDWDEDSLTESTWYINADKNLLPGVYTLSEDIMSPKTGEIIALKKSKIKVEGILPPSGTCMGLNVYEVKHVLTGQNVYITNRNINR